MHTGGAGGEIVALVGHMKDGRLTYAKVAWRKADRYGHIDGLPSEVMPTEMVRVVEKIYGGK